MSRRLQGLVVLFCFLTFVLGVRANCAWPPLHKRALLATDCPGFPKDGTWLVTHTTPPLGVPDVPSTILEGRSVLMLKRDNFVRDAYSGDGAALWYLNSIAPIFGGKTTWDYHVALIFDDKACLLTGIIYRHDAPVFADAVEWTYDGNKIEGKCLFTSPVDPTGPPVPRYANPAYSHHSLVYIGPNDMTPAGALPM